MYDIEGNMGTLQKPKLFKSHFQGNNWTTQFFANYDQTFNKVHTVGATIGIEANKSTYDNSSLSLVDYFLDVDQMGAGPVSTAYICSAEGEAANAAVIARIKYDYASKYVAEASMRYDGSDLFPEDKRWGTFFSGSLAWVISEEGFWQTLKERHIFDTFKIRGSYGEIGQSNIERYAYLQSYNLEERGYYIGGQWMPGFSEGGLVSKDISWYSVKDMNIGIDFGSLNNRLSEENIQRIVSAVAERKDEQHFARLVPNDEVGSKQNKYNLSVSTYVEQEDTREKIDIVKLNAEIAEIVAREQKLREEIDRIIGEIEG